MRVKYLIRLIEPISLEDHWPISILNGSLRVVTKNGLAYAFEAVFLGQPTTLSPDLSPRKDERIAASIRVRDNLLPFVTSQLEKAFAFIQCYFDISIIIDEVEAEYQGETEEEERQIKIKSYKTEKAPRPVRLPFDMLTRAIMAAEQHTGPEFEATLVSSARKASLQKKYIDSFRYSFLLIESVFGDGKFRMNHLKAALKDKADLKKMIESTLQDPLLLRGAENSDTQVLLRSNPTFEMVVDHLVEKRGFYFHGNTKHKNAWQPQDQKKAELLSRLSLNIAMHISHNAAGPMFDPALSQRHFDAAKRAGAIMTVNVEYFFYDPDDKVSYRKSVNFTVPGTQPTPKMAAYLAQQSLEKFIEVAPNADLKAVICSIPGTEKKLFTIECHLKTENGNE